MSSLGGDLPFRHLKRIIDDQDELDFLGEVCFERGDVGC